MGGVAVVAVGSAPCGGVERRWGWGRVAGTAVAGVRAVGTAGGVAGVEETVTVATGEVKVAAEATAVAVGMLVVEGTAQGEMGEVAVGVMVQG